MPVRTQNLDVNENKAFRTIYETRNEEKNVDSKAFICKLNTIFPDGLEAKRFKSM